jgi:predicted nucleic acid-binding protein
MARERVLVDTGPLVALLANDDADHDRCVQESRKLLKPFHTTWPVLTEAAWLLRDAPEGIPRLLDLLQQDLIDCVELDNAAAANPQLADLSLVYLANKIQLQNVFTLDRRDFTVYRNEAGRPFQLFPQ